MIAVRRPADGGRAGTVAEASAADVRRAAARLREAQGAWEQAGVRGRGVHITALRDWILDHEDHLLDLLQAETGKTRADAVIDLMSPLDVLNHYLEHGERYLEDSRPRPHAPAAWIKALSVNYRPYPLVAVISPWNFPVGLSLMDAVPALVAGCAVLVKPSEITPLAVTEIGRAWREDLGAPDVLAVVNGGPATGQAVVDAADFVQFTGSAATGKAVLRQAAETLTPVSLELGGKDAMIVCADADLERAANGAAWGGIFNAGQVCVSVERVYVEAPVYDEFVDRLTRKVAALRAGADVGALVTDRQTEIVEGHVLDAVELGAAVRCGGHRGPGPGNTFEPTVLADVDHEMACMREETFGPTLPVMRVADVDEAVRLANDSDYGLSASVWTRDRAAGRAIARRLEVGAVNINDVVANLSQAAVPMGGWKSSGLGARLGGAQGLRKFCRTQAVTDGRIALSSEPNWFPYTPARGRFVRRLLRLNFARGRRRLVRG